MFLIFPQMAKNKGLTPKRKKIDRNPRVKHREKYRRAQIRRKGQVCIAHLNYIFSYSIDAASLWRLSALDLLQ